MHSLKSVVAGFAFVVAAGALASPAAAQQAAQPARLSVPIDYYNLPNGLKVVLSRDTTLHGDSLHPPAAPRHRQSAGLRTPRAPRPSTCV